MEEIIRIPEERIAVLIGTKGNIKKQIVKETKTKIDIDSKEGEVNVFGEGENFFKAIDVIKAIARGFSPKRAFKLFEKNYLLKIINIPDLVGGNKSAQEAKRGRVIGKEGIARKEIEKKTSSLISVYGKTVSIIATPNTIEQAQEAIEMLLKGYSHDSMESFLNHKDKHRFEL
jgi:ribosomal RNA assembly protein